MNFTSRSCRLHSARVGEYKKLILLSDTIALLFLGGVVGCAPIQSGREQEALNTAASLARTETATAAKIISAQLTDTPTVTITFTPPPSDTPTSTHSPTPEAGATMVSEKDSMTMVYVPAGPFLMGSSEEEIDIVSEYCTEKQEENNSPYTDTRHDPCQISNYDDERPQLEVYLDAFWIDQTEVTNAQYKQCVTEGQCLSPTRDCQPINPTYLDSDMGNYPVVCVDWSGAQAYCEWAGRRLPTNAEWEKAARGTDGRIYPWGNDTPRCYLANTQACVAMADEVGLRLEGASPYGALDMLGNVSEWVADWYDKDYYTYSPKDNPPGPISWNTGIESQDWEVRVVRGGSYRIRSWLTRAAERQYRGMGIIMYGSIGFRCVLPTTPEEN